MTKLLVMPRHAHGPLKNGEDGCHARFGNDGMCPGVQTANWLNGLGEDDEQYSSMKETRNVDVRLNWIRSNEHIVVLDEEMESLQRQEQALRQQQRDLQKRLRQVRGLMQEAVIRRVMES